MCAKPVTIQSMCDNCGNPAHVADAGSEEVKEPETMAAETPAEETPATEAPAEEGSTGEGQMA